MATMRQAPVDAAGTALGYIDSGPPPSDTYITVILVHGLSYNCRIFARLLPLAALHNLRIIAINRRDYTGSTPLTDTDLALLFSKRPEDHEQFLHARGLEVAHFLAWVIDELKIPPAAAQSEGSRSGGLTLLGWSLGSITTLAFLRHLSSFPKELIDKLSRYLKTFVIYDSGYATLGYPHPPGMYHPLHDTSISASERNANFNAWISSYYIHPYYASSNPSRATRTLEYLALHMATHPKIDVYSTDVTGSKSPSYENVEPDAFAATVETFPERSEKAFLGMVRPETLLDQLRGAVFPFTSVTSVFSPSDEDGQTERIGDTIPLPDLQVIYTFGANSPWTTQWSSWQLEADREAHPENYRRRLELVRVEGGNHFLHWDNPNKFLSILAGKSEPSFNSGNL